MNLRQAAAACRLVARYALGNRRPLLLGLVVTERCNLDCTYCRSHSDASVHFTFDGAKRTLEAAHARGHRAMYVTGGEPMLWRDGPFRLADIVAFARSLGFFHFSVYTNGTLPLSIPRCTYIVTIDGPREVHEESRPGTFDRILENVRQAKSQKIVASMMVSRQNWRFAREFVREMSATGLFRGIAFNLFTGTPEERARFGLSGDEPAQVLDTFWQCRCEGYPVVLSRAEYQAWRSNDWPRPIWQVEVCTPAGFWPCCRDIGNPAVCEECGYLGCVALSQLFNFEPSAIFQALRLS